MRLEERYNNEIKDAMMAKFSYKSVMEIPKLVKVVINMGVSDARENSKACDSAAGDLAVITGQKAVITKAKKSVAQFKVREGMNLGCKVTLRRSRMYEFVDRLSLTRRCRAYATSEESIPIPSTAEAIITSALRSS